MRHSGILIAVIVGGAFAALSRLPAAPAPAGMNYYFGNLHAHTSFSDGVGTPQEAYAHARDVGGLDFMALTEHNHPLAEKGIIKKEDKERKDGVMIGADHSLYDELIAVADAINSNGAFIAFYGQEFSTISKGNHVNVLMARKVITTDYGDYTTVFTRAWMDDHGAALIQFNHPWDGKEDGDPVTLAECGTSQDTNYGFNAFKTVAKFRSAVEGKARLVEVANGPGMKKDPAAGHKPHRGVGFYRAYLNMGLHVAPSANQDNHWRTWGDLTNARTVVMAPSLSRAALLQAMQQRRVYASEIKDLQVTFTLNGALMGRRLPKLAGGQIAQIEVKVESEDDPLSNYGVRLFYDEVGGDPAQGALGTVTVGNAGVATFTHRPTNGKGYYFVEVECKSGPNDGRRAWTAPIWLG